MSHLLSAFIRNPLNTKFETQQDNERIVLLLRRAPITNLGWILISIILIIAPFLVRLVFPLINIPIDTPQAQRLVFIFSVLTEVVALGYIFEQFLNYYFSIYIITNLRIVDIDFVNLVNKKISETQLQDIEDVTLTQNGIFQSIFNYGDVLVQTAGKDQEFLLYAVPRPSEVIELISELQPMRGSE